MITGTSGITLKFDIPNDVTIVCDSGNWSKTGGTVEVGNGDLIHFEAPITKTGTWSSSQIPKSYIFNSILAQTSDSGLQRLVRLGKKDPTTYTSISINFISTGAFEIHKTDENGYGYGTLEGLYAGNYTLNEENSTENYYITSLDENRNKASKKFDKIINSDIINMIASYK